MPIAPRDQWFVVQVLAGHEQKIKENIERRVQLEEMGDFIYEIVIPTERVQEVKRGKKIESTRKFFPGYIIVNMHLLDEASKLIEKSWFFMRNTDGVLGFAGNKDRPTPMRSREVAAVLAQMKDREGGLKPKITFEVGDKIKVADGPFQSQIGVVEEVDPERGKLRVSVTIFGRETPVDLEYWQVEKGS